MAFIDKSTLVLPATSSFPGRRWTDTRDPVSGVNGDYRQFQISDIWINYAALRAWIMVARTVNSGTWIQMADTGTGILTITGNTGGAVSADGANNINLLGTSPFVVAGDMGTNTLSITSNGTLATSYVEDAGSAAPVAGILNIVGTGGVNTIGAGNTVTIHAGSIIPTIFTEDAGSATPSGNNLNILGANGITTSGAGSTVTVTAGPTIATTYNEDAGSATPAGNILNIVGGIGISTSGAGSTVTINEIQKASFSAFKSANTANATGDGTVVTVIFDTIQFNNGGGYNAGTGAFTAPTTGLYYFYFTIALINFTAAHTTLLSQFQVNATPRNTGMIFNPFATQEVSSGSANALGHALLSLTAGDTVVCHVLITGGAKTVTLSGGGQPFTTFGGFQIF